MKRWKPASLLVAALAILAAIPLGARAQVTDSVKVFNRNIREQEKRLENLRTEIRDIRKRDLDLDKKERNTAKQLRLLDKEAALTADLLRTLDAKQKRISEQLEGIRAEHESATETLAERRSRLARTVRTMYVSGTPTTAEVVLRATNLQHALSHFKYLETLARNNERLVIEIREQERYLAATDAKLTQTLSEIHDTAEETREEKQRLAESRQTRQTTLKRVREQRAEYQRALKDLSASENKVQSFIATLEKRRQAAIAAGRVTDTFPDIGFTLLRGKLPWPVRGRIVAGFGRQKHPRYGTFTENSGIDIAANEGEPVRAVARGQAEYVAWLDGYGKTILLNHGGHYTLYAHLSEALVAEGQAVDPGQIIGRVGDTGSLDGSKLHFEVRVKAEAVDPRLWLAK